jgi:tRNA pseudouridine32 synthase/23S rRNA pseudouridine746 synthase
VYQDEHILVVNKPPGLLCVPGLSDPNNLYDNVTCIAPNARVIHRLDMSTSGLVIFALHHQAQKHMGKLFEQRKIKKSYAAIVHGIVQDTRGEIHSRMLCDWPNRPKQKIDWLTGKLATTFFTVLSRNKDRNCTRLCLSPHTGRTHQLRLHMWQLGYPILGDQLYFDGDSRNLENRLLLHAQQLQFDHPVTNRALTLQSEPEF